MFLVAVFHWYTASMFSPLALCIICLGISSLVTQIVLVREFLTIFAGNEIVIGVILANWLLLAGFGTYLARNLKQIKNTYFWLLCMQAAISILALMQLAALRFFRVLFVPGLMLGIQELFISSLLILAPFCLISGAMLTLFSKKLSAEQDFKHIGNVFSLDVLGGVVGGLIFYYVLVHSFNSYETLLVLVTLNLLAAFLLSLKHPAFRKLKLAQTILVIGLFSTPFLWPMSFEDLTLSALYPKQTLVKQLSTPYGALVLTSQDKQLSLYANGVAVASNQNPIEAEEAVHYAMSQHPNPQKVLLVSGALNGAINEVLKYQNAKLDYLELDPQIITILEDLVSVTDSSRVQMIAADARQYIRKQNNHYDVVLLNIPDPDSAQLNRYYTKEFFLEVEKAAKPNAVISLSLSGAENYASAEVALMSASIYQALKKAFRNIVVIPGATQFFIASNSKLSYEISKLLREKGIATTYVKEAYLAAKLTKDRLASTSAMLETQAPLNEDLAPIGYYAHLKYWLKKAGAEIFVPILFVLSILLIMFFFLLRSSKPAIALALGSSGFAGMALEVVIILGFQVYYGYVYQQMALIFTVFLIGSALGAFWSNKKTNTFLKYMLVFDIALSLLAFVLPLYFIWLQSQMFSSDLNTSLALGFYALNALVGFIVGAQFPLAAKSCLSDKKSDQSQVAGELFAVDFLGGCLGAFVIGVFCIPVLGVIKTCFLIGFIKLASVMVLKQSRAEKGHLASSSLFPALFSLLVFIGIGLAIHAESTRSFIYNFSFYSWYHVLVVVLLAFGIIEATSAGLIGKLQRAYNSFNKYIEPNIGFGLMRWINFCALASIALFPIFRCYFKIPYLFCHVCPRKCVFGFLRPYIIPAALIMNLERRHFCHQVCPLGTLQQCGVKATGSSKRFFSYGRFVAFAVLLFTVVSYFWIKIEENASANFSNYFYTYLFNNRYMLSELVLGIAILIVVLSYKYYRPFCELLCPVGVFSDIIAKFEKLFSSKQSHMAANSEEGHGRR